jgi:hypothetical protein
LTSRCAGKVTLITRLIRLGTSLDNVGANAEIVDKDIIENMVEAYPRKSWGSCFRDTVLKGKEAKSCAIVSWFEGFEDMIMANKIMRKYD